jgi:hypothetical protein
MVLSSARAGGGGAVVGARNAALWTATITASLLVPFMILGIIGFILPLSASDALNKPPRGAHQLGSWLLFLPSLPLWLMGLWLTTLAAVRDRLSHRVILRRTIWLSATALTLLAFCAGKNVFGFGDLFSPF